jgi:hypothetical protein
MAVERASLLWATPGAQRVMTAFLGACLSIRLRKTRHNCRKSHEISTSRISRPSPARSGDTAGDTEPEKPPLPTEPVRGRLQV